MSDDKSNDSRRKLLKSIALGGGIIVTAKSLPESWAKPVVDSVMLPAHAQTSQCCDIDGGYCANITLQAPTYLEFSVNTDGRILISINNQDGPDESIETSVPCNGGNFNVSGNDYTVTGNVSCGRLGISGELTWTTATPSPIVVAYDAGNVGCI